MEDTATLNSERPSAFFQFNNTLEVRDLAVVRVEMLTRGACPGFSVLDANLKEILSHDDSTPGAAIERVIAVSPRKPYYVRVFAAAFCREPDKALPVRFKVSMIQKEAADPLEANETALEASAMKSGQQIEANIMDKDDRDWYRVAASSTGKLNLRLENRSPTLCPVVILYNSNKSQQLVKHDDTPGANLEFPIDVEPGKDFYLQIAPGPTYRNDSYGEYQLLISERG